MDTKKNSFLQDLLRYANNNNDWTAVMTSICRMREWGVLRGICRRKPKFNAESFELFVKCYQSIIRKKDVPVVYREMEDLIFNHELVPFNVNTAQDAKRWLGALKKFFIISGELKVYDDVEEMVYLWLIETYKKHRPKHNIFGIMLEKGLNDKKLWSDIFPSEMLFRHGEYDLLMSIGQVEFLIQKGKYDYVISHFVELIPEYADSPEKYGQYVHLITDDMLTRYSRRFRRNVAFYAYHPHGLQILVDGYRFGDIGKLRDKFSATAKNIPSYFRFSEAEKSGYRCLWKRVQEEFL
jgi:hypothetical protein